MNKRNSETFIKAVGWVLWLVFVGLVVGFLYRCSTLKPADDSTSPSVQRFGALNVGATPLANFSGTYAFVNSTGQTPQIYTAAGGGYKISVSGTFVGTLSFGLSQDGGATFPAANLSQGGLYNCTTCTFDTTATAPGTWYYAPIAGSDGVLQVQATAWTSGTAVISMVDLVATPQKVDLMLVPPGTRTTTYQAPTFLSIPGCFKAMQIFSDITAASGTGGIAPELSLSDPLSGATYLSAIIGTSKTAASLYSYQYGPSQGLNVANGGVQINYLPSRIIPRAIAADSTSYTYSISGTLIPY